MVSYKQQHEGRRQLLAKEAAELATLNYKAKATEVNRLIRELDALRRANDKAVADYNRSRGLA